MSLAKKLTFKGTLGQVFYLSEAPSFPVTQYSPSVSVYLFTQGRGES
jgi:hypothetical protein